MEEIAGPYCTDEAGLVRAMDALASSRAARVAAVDRYAGIRREAKRRGESDPTAGPAEPAQPGDLVRRRSAGRAARPAPASGGTRPSRPGVRFRKLEARLNDLTDAAIGSGGQLDGSVAWALVDILQMLQFRLTSERFQDDRTVYFHSLRLWRIGRMLNDALSPGLASIFPA